MDSFPSYELPNLKSGERRLLIKNVDDYLAPMAHINSPAEDLNREKFPRKRIRNLDGVCSFSVKEEEPIQKQYKSMNDEEGSHKSYASTTEKLPPPLIATFSGPREPFSRWGRDYEGFPIESRDSKASYCGICSLEVQKNDLLRCRSCQLIIHQSCLVHTIVKDANLEGEWSCPICILNTYCTTHTFNGLSNNCELRENFCCVFCPENHPLLFLERMKSGLFAHSICRLIANQDELIPSNCAICGKNTNGVVRCGSPNCLVVFHPSCAWLKGYSFARSLDPEQDIPLALL
jgi:hypothetical protein